MRIIGFFAALGLLVGAPLVTRADANTQAASNGTQSGEVKSYSNGTLSIVPYNTLSDLTQFKIDPSTPVLQGKGKVSTQALAAGTNVRIDYSAAPGQDAHATNIQILAPDQVAAEKTQAQTAAPKMAQNAATAGALDPKQKELLLKSASGSQPGKIVSSDPQTLVLDPYQKAAGNSTLRMEPSSVVFQANNKTDTTALKPGTDVRVFYKNQPTGKPTVIAVELLNPQDAQTLEKAERDLPRK